MDETHIMYSTVHTACINMEIPAMALVGPDGPFQESHPYRNSPSDYPQSQWHPLHTCWASMFHCCERKTMFTKIALLVPPTLNWHLTYKYPVDLPRILGSFEVGTSAKMSAARLPARKWSNSSSSSSMLEAVGFNIYWPKHVSFWTSGRAQKFFFAAKKGVAN